MTVANYPDPRPVDPVAPTSAAAGAATLRPLEHTRRAMSLSLLLAGVLMALAAAWGAVVVFVGPAFGFSADGSGSWHWTLSHSLLALIPGSVAFVAGVIMAVLALKARLHRGAFVACGLVGMLCGAWFVVGPMAWPVLYGNGGYFVSTGALRSLANHIGYALGPGLIVAACGAYAVGWGVARREEAELASPYGLSGRVRTTPAGAPEEPMAEGVTMPAPGPGGAVPDSNAPGAVPPPPMPGGGMAPGMPPTGPPSGMPPPTMPPQTMPPQTWPPSGMPPPPPPPSRAVPDPDWKPEPPPTTSL